MEVESSSFEVVLAFQGQTERLSSVTTQTTGQELSDCARAAFSLDDDSVTLKLLYKGKVLQPHDIVFPSQPPAKKNRILIMASSHDSITTLNSKRSDPTIRGFHQEKRKPSTKTTPWGPNFTQDKNFKFCRFQACTWQSFGHRANESNTPHAFRAMELLEKLATDPGVVAIMKERELVVNTLGEMDPIDDRLKQKLDAKGSCLLGYNTNRGLRIDVKLRPDSLEGFLPYSQIVSTLIHELSHNWVSEHDLLFFTNFGQMRVEYLHKHASLAASGVLVNGKTTAQVAEISLQGEMSSIAQHVLKELEKDMAQHGLHPQAIAPAILERCRQLQSDFEQSEEDRRVGSVMNGNSSGTTFVGTSARERALAAAERRAAAQAQKNEENQKDDMKDESSKSS